MCTVCPVKKTIIFISRFLTHTHTQGSCDEGKQYCCYNDFDGANAASKEIDKYGGERSEPVPSILVGPGANNRPGLRPGIYGQVYNKNVRPTN